MMGSSRGCRRWHGFVISVVFTGWLATGYATKHAGAWSSKTPTRCPSSSTRPSSTERDGEGVAVGRVSRSIDHVAVRSGTSRPTGATVLSDFNAR